MSAGAARTEEGRRPVVTTWSPLRSGAFGSLWTAWLIINTCLWMCDVTAAWVMATLTHDPVLVSLVQTSASLASVLLALPSGVVADLLDRRRMFLFTHLWQAGTAALLAVGTATGALAPAALLVLVFCNGLGMAMRWPTFAAIVPEAVQPHEVPQAVALHAMAVNGSRVMGPLLVGVLLAVTGGTAVFVLSAVLALVAAWLTWRWRPAPRVMRPREGLASALGAGVLFVARSEPMRATMVRIFFVFFTVVPVQSMMPLLAKSLEGGGAGTYTLLLSCMGVGAVAVAMSMPLLRRRTSLQGALVAGSLLQAAATAALALAPSALLAAVAATVCGAAWLAAANSGSLSSQLALPDWVRARGMSLFLVAAMAGGAAGAAAVGVVASALGVRGALYCLAATGVAMVLLLRGFRLPDARTFLQPAGPATSPPPPPSGPDR